MPKPLQNKVLICLVLALVTLALYWPVRHHEFINYDDPDYISANPVVQQGLALPGLKWAFTTTHSYNWHPITWISHMLDVQFIGTNPGAHHLSSVSFHIANAVLLFLLLHRMTRSLWRSGFVAAIFAWHPLHIESVAWACERKDVLSTLFWLLTLLAYVSYSECRRRGPKFPARRYYVAAVTCFALGLMAKPMLVTVPFVLLLLDLWPLQRITAESRPKPRTTSPPATALSRIKPLLLEKVPFFALSLASCVVTFLVQRREGAVVKLEHLPIDDRLANAIVSYVRYIWKTVWPTDLVIFYEPVTAFSHWIIAGAASLILFLSGSAIWQIKLRPYLAVGWFWFLGTLVPVIGVVQVGMQSMADRYMYVPMIGLLIMTAWGIGQLVATRKVHPKWVACATLPALLGCLISARAQLDHWKNSEAVFQHVLNVYPNHVMARVMLANAYVERQRPEDAIRHFREVLALQPAFAEVHFNLANVLVSQQKIGEAIAEYKLALHHNPQFADAHANMAVALGMEGRLEEAVEQYQLALRLAPTQPDVLRNMAIDLATLRRFDEASAQLEQVVRLNPADSLAYKLLGDTVAAQGRWRDAAGHYTMALRLRPDFREARDKLDLANQKAVESSTAGGL